MAAGAALLAAIGIAFVFVTITVALSLVVPTWLACLIVTATLFAVAAVLVLLARGRFQKAAPPVPEQALEQAKLTTEAIKG
jgi:multisubunit Na+/H+ antiporter MnhC subunit